MAHLIKTYNDNIRQPVQLSQALQELNQLIQITLRQPFSLRLEALNFQQTNLAQIGLVLPLSGDGQILVTTVQSGFNDAKVTQPFQYKCLTHRPPRLMTLLHRQKASGIKALVGHYLNKTSMPSLRIKCSTRHGRAPIKRNSKCSSN